jgi:iron-sulfur cluster assembly protein
MIHVTPSAVVEMRRLLNKQNKEGWGIRVGVKGGGCFGLSYTMDIAGKPTEHDRVFDVDGLQVFCDPKSYLYLNGLSLDYNDQLIGGGFQFNNPNAARTCSCGSSFSA